MTVLLMAALSSAGTMHEIELTGGASALVRDDRMVGAIPHSGLAPGGALSWTPRGDRDANRIRLGFQPATLRGTEDFTYTWDGEKKSSGPDAVSIAELQYAYGRRLDGTGFTLHLGGTVAGHIEDVSTNYAFMGVKTYLGVFELGPWADLRIPVGQRHAFEVEGWIPVANYVARNRYGVHDDAYIDDTRDLKTLPIIGRLLASGSPYTLNAYQAAHLRAGFTLGLSDTFAVVTRARLDAVHLTISHPMVEWQAGLDLGIRGRF